MVRSSENYGFGAIPKIRGAVKDYVAFSVIILFVLHYVYVVPSLKVEDIEAINETVLKSKDDLQMLNLYHYIFSLPMMFYGVILAKFLQCIFVFIGELWHVGSRHEGSCIMLFQNSFQAFHSVSGFLRFFGLVICLGMVCYLLRAAYRPLFDQHHLIYWPVVFTSAAVSLITDNVFGFKTLSVVELSEIHESSEVNVAQGLAWSYYTGYLNIILPNLRTTIKKDDRWRKELKAGNLPCKFFAIVPLNCKIPSKMGECDEHDGIEFESKLPTLLFDRAGVKDRPYVNSVYTIKNEKGESYFAICEYVTIIDTLHQMPLCTEINKKTREDQCRLLVRKLNELINSDDSRNKCKGMCEIVPFSGENDHLLRNVLIDKIKQGKYEMPIVE